MNISLNMTIPNISTPAYNSYMEIRIAPAYDFFIFYNFILCLAIVIIGYFKPLIDEKLRYTFNTDIDADNFIDIIIRIILVINFFMFFLQFFPNFMLYKFYYI